ncbi:MAG: CinA family protein [Burkholderiaceae bacterium]|jgi:nicotinamide-nucleotide amidase|nr:CinA family protein [Burkholderiaceae bacterium]
MLLKNERLVACARADAAHAVVDLAVLLKARGWHMATAESCTGGLIAAACTDQAGSSDWFDRGWVTYSNAAKTQLLGVPADLIERHGAVSASVARALALGARERAGVQAAVAVTGVAGPGGGPDKPVGTVWFGWCVGDRAWTAVQRFEGDRAAVRAQTVAHALTRLCDGVRAAAD